jgi:hypothetical protein
MTLAAEQAIIDQTNAAIAAGQDPFGDEDGFETTTTTADDQTTTDGAADGAAGDEPQGDPAGDGADNQPTDETTVDAAALEAIANGEEAPTAPALPTVADPLNFNVNAPADYKTARAALVAEETEAFAKLMGGEMDSAEYAAIKSRVLDSLEDLSAQRIRAETLQELNAQSAAKTQTQVIQQLVASTAAEVPYATDAKAQRQFDMALQQVGADPDNAGKSFANLAGEAHKVVLALRGITAKTTPAAAAEARKPQGQAPVTLRSIPNAATSNSGGNIVEQLSRLSGQDYEAAYDRLTPQQKASMLDD